jgi:hypothetical protein
VPRTIRCSAELSVDRLSSDVIPLFTPEGERSWADGWDPRYPEPQRREKPGAVFLTRHGDEETAWVVVDQSADRVRYARVTPDVSAGTVEVSVLATEQSHTRLRVDYDLTALSDAAVQRLEEFEAQFSTYIAHWETAIAHRHKT